MRHIKETLQNGLRIVLCPFSHVKSVTIGIWIGVGGRHESDASNGISHFLEHMLFKGTQERSARDITEAIEGVGGNMNAFTTEEYTCYYAKVPYQHQEMAIDVLTDMYQNPLLDSGHIEKEKEVILEERKMHVDVPSQHVYDLLSQAIWPAHPLGRMLIGSEKSIKSFKRSHFTQFRKKYYCASNTVISIAGAINTPKTIRHIKKKFSRLSKGKSPSFICVKENQSHPKIKMKVQQTQQCHLGIGIRSLPRMHPDRYILRVLNVILGENMSSRLFQEIREKRGLSYDISSSIERYLDTGILVISGGTDLPRLTQTVQSIMQVLKDMKSGISKDELIRGKEYLSGQISLAMERTSNQMVYMGESEISEDKILSYKEIIQAIKKIKLDDIIRVSSNLFIDKNLNMAVIGPKHSQTELNDAFHIQES